MTSPPTLAHQVGFRRLDHIAIAVQDTPRALSYFGGALGLKVVHVDELDTPPVTLTYLDAGNIYIQLLSPRAPCALSHWLADHGEGLHHICFAVDDVRAAVGALSDGQEPELGSGRGRISSFARNDTPFGVLIECTEFCADDGPALARSARHFNGPGA